MLLTEELLVHTEDSDTDNEDNDDDDDGEPGLVKGAGPIRVALAIPAAARLALERAVPRNGARLVRTQVHTIGVRRVVQVASLRCEGQSGREDQR